MHLPVGVVGQGTHGDLVSAVAVQVRNDGEPVPQTFAPLAVHDPVSRTLTHDAERREPGREGPIGRVLLRSADEQIVEAIAVEIGHGQAMTEHSRAVEDRRGAVAKRNVDLGRLRQPERNVAEAVSVQVTVHRLAGRRVVVPKHDGGRHVTGHATFALSNEAADQLHARAVGAVHGRCNLRHTVTVMVHANRRGKIGVFGDHASLESISEHLPPEQFVPDDGVDFDATVDRSHFHFTGHWTGIDQGAVPQDALVPHQPKFAAFVDDRGVLSVLVEHQRNGGCIHVEHEGAHVPDLVEVHRIREGLACCGEVLTVPDDDARAVIGRGRHRTDWTVTDVVHGGHDAGGPRRGYPVRPSVVLAHSAVMDLPLVVDPAQMAHAGWSNRPDWTERDRGALGQVRAEFPGVEDGLFSSDAVVQRRHRSVARSVFMAAGRARGCFGGEGFPSLIQIGAQAHGLHGKNHHDAHDEGLQGANALHGHAS